jgi:hypothetical protein
MKRYAFAAALILLVIEPAPAGLMAVWSYEALFEKSDLVVIATPISPTRDTAERTTLADITPPTAVIGVVTEFETLLVLKGKKQARLTFHHYRLPESDEALVNGPSLVEFPKVNQLSYLLFLVRERDGRFAPVAGQTDPKDVSVQKLSGFHAGSPNQAMQPTASPRTASLSHD